jgi:hypothetical protein
MLKNFENFPRFVIFRIAFIPIPDINRAWQATETCRINRPARPTEIKMRNEIETTVCGKQIQHDNSGVGHNWRNIAADDIPASVREEIAAEILDGDQDECECYTASNGRKYRW